MTTTNTPDHNCQTIEPPVAKTITRADFTFGVIAARVGETRFAKGGCRYGVVFRRNVSDLCLEGEFSMSLGQDELMNLIAAASEAYHVIEDLRFQRAASKPPAKSIAYKRLEQSDGWEPDHDEVFPSQIES